MPHPLCSFLAAVQCMIFTIYNEHATEESEYEYESPVPIPTEAAVSGDKYVWTVSTHSPIIHSLSTSTDRSPGPRDDCVEWVVQFSIDTVPEGMSKTQWKKN